MRAVLGVLVLAAAPVLAEPRIELYTMGQGDALFSKFGHAALCVAAPELPAGGLCYNYGTTDFSRPVGLGWDVVRGRAKFWVSVSDLLGMRLNFEAQDRTIYRQVLPLDPSRTSYLAEALAVDSAPENREYIYSHFLDNCSTRPRDLVDEATEGALRATGIDESRTYRDFAREGFAAQHWALVPAGDLILGRWVDQDIEPYEAMFIPEVLRRAVTAELGVEPELVYERQRPLPAADVDGALVRFWGVVALGVGLAWASRAAARAGIVVVAVAGALLWIGMLLSPWPELRTNELVLVLVPLDALLLSGRRDFYRYLRVRLVMCLAVAALALVGLLVQPIWPFWALATGVLASFWWRARGRARSTGGEAG